ncbi:MAG: metallophosphoesterase family protein [Bryobacterales bacterium]|nr:metallophosphoesterase family protein [Bryobacterales bacterium]MBV9401285.1 metallophosphoesterase family protein [Bryobacterales bacterium]
MPYLILSDVHANREALEAVIRDAEGRYDQILCLGDLVGYGADPNHIVDWVRQNANNVIRGNHDKVCVDIESIGDYNPAAQASAEWTQAVLTQENSSYLRNLARGPLRVNGFDLVHGSPLDEDDYLISPGDVAPLRGVLDARVTFFGHTHIQGGFLLARGGIRRLLPGWAMDETLTIEPDHYYMLNPGSVGQPRDMDPRAAYAIYTPENRTIEFRRAHYDIARAAQKILDAGLPTRLAARLYEGA